MPINPERLSRLQSLGLNEQQARAYLALLDQDTATVNDLSKTSRVPRAKLYEVMEALNRKGLVDVIPETPQRFRANPLSALYDTRVQELRSEESELKRTIGDLMVNLLPKERAPKSEGDAEFIHVLHGRPHFVVQATKLVDAARGSLFIYGDRLLLPRLRLYEELGQSLVKASDRATLRILVPDQASDQLDGRRVRFDEFPDAIRTASSPPGDVCVLARDDEEYLLVHFLPNDLHASRGGDRLEVGHDAEIATLWHRVGNQLWEAARPWKRDGQSR